MNLRLLAIFIFCCIRAQAQETKVLPSGVIQLTQTKCNGQMALLHFRRDKGLFTVRGSQKGSALCMRLRFTA